MKLNILESEGYMEIHGSILSANMLEYMKPLKTMKVNIGIDKKLKSATIGDYWDEETISQIAELLREY